MMTPERLAHKSESRKAMWADPDTRARLVAAMQAGRRYRKSLLTPDTL